MKYTIHYTIHGVEDSFVISGETIRDIREEANRELKKRKLDVILNNVYSTVFNRIGGNIACQQNVKK